MYLFIDTSNIEYIMLALIDAQGGVLAKEKIAAKYKQSEKLIKEIERLGNRIKGLKSIRESLKGIIVVKGPGSFTGLRIGVTTANALGFSLGVPVVGVMGEFEEMIKDLIKKLEIQGRRLNQHRKLKGFREYVVPEYGMEPKITLR